VVYSEKALADLLSWMILLKSVLKKLHSYNSDVEREMVRTETMPSVPYIHSSIMLSGILISGAAA
jgi:hypothetical protein